MSEDSVLEARIPDLNPWSGVGVLALHSHTADEPCHDQCTVYTRTGPNDTTTTRPTPKTGRR